MATAGFSGNPSRGGALYNPGTHSGNFGGHVLRAGTARPSPYRTYAARSSKLRKPARRAAQSAMAPTIFADSSGFLSGPCHVSSISASRLQAPEHVNDITVYGGHHENFGGHHENFGG